MQEIDVRFNYIGQEAGDALAATLDCAKGRIQPNPTKTVLTGILTLLTAFIFFVAGIMSFTDSAESTIYIFSGFIRCAYGMFSLWLTTDLFRKYAELNRRRKQGLTEEDYLAEWYGADGIGRREVQLVFKGNTVDIMPNEKSLHQMIICFGRSRIFEYSSGVVIIPAYYGERFYFIPRRVLDEHNGEIEKFLEKKFRKRYKVTGR